MHPACASLITRCIQFQFQFPSSPSKRNEAPISNSTSALPPFHALTRTDLEPRAISHQHCSVSQLATPSVVPCRACVVS